jgi:hypothetical protein
MSNKFPPGWDKARVERLIAHYETLGEDEQVAEDEAPFEDEGLTMMAVPKDLVPEIRRLLAEHSAKTR